MEYNTKCAIIGRKKISEDSYNCLINLFDVNDGHLTGDVPKEFLEFENIKRVEIKSLNVSYFLQGNDLVLNNLESIDIENQDNNLIITANQK